MCVFLGRSLFQQRREQTVLFNSLSKVRTTMLLSVLAFEPALSTFSLFTSVHWLFLFVVVVDIVCPYPCLLFSPFFIFWSLFRKAHKYNCLLVCFFNSRTQVLFCSLSTLEFDICTNVLKREDLAINPLNSANYCIGYYGSFFYTQISSFFQLLCVYVCMILFFVFYKCEMHFLWSHMYFSFFFFWFASLKLHWRFVFSFTFVFLLLFFFSHIPTPFFYFLSFVWRLFCFFFLFPRLN